jgi:hypothetical protein
MMVVRELLRSSMNPDILVDRFPSQTWQAPIALPLRNLLCTFALTLVALAVAGSFWGLIGYEMLVVSMGWPHILLGFLFYFGRVLRGEERARLTFILLTLATLALWVTHYTFTITGFISVYFTYHVFRDEVFIYFQTRAKHKLKTAVYVAGLVPFILLMFLVTDPRPQHYRHDLRHVTLQNTSLSNAGWTLFSFKPISYSQNKEFYFYLQTPNTEDADAFNIFASTSDTRREGEIRISDQQWTTASDLIFKPYYAEDGKTSPEPLSQTENTIPVSLKGGHKVGQTFTAERDNLSGIWIPTTHVTAPGGNANFVFHLTPDTTLPLPQLSPFLNTVRWVLIVILGLLVIWKVAPQFTRNRQFWIYFLLFLVVFAVLQKVIRLGKGEYEFPIMFQLVVVFHYWSWYVFSIDKLRALPNSVTNMSAASTLYDRIMSWFRTLPKFIALTVGLNLISLAGVIWYSKLDGPAPLRFVFDYSYFLYFLVLHVTFSFAPKLLRANGRTVSKL